MLMQGDIVRFCPFQVPLVPQEMIEMMDWVGIIMDQGRNVDFYADRIIFWFHRPSRLPMDINTPTFKLRLYDDAV